MSSWGAVEKGGDALSVWDYRAIFLKFGIKYEEFYCPFCDIRLASSLVYTEGEISKTPYFSARWGEHTNCCDGAPIIVDASKPKLPENHFLTRDMHYPEAFTNRPPPRVLRNAGADELTIPPSSLEVALRRKKAGSLGQAQPRTYLLQPIVEVYNSVLKGGYDLAKEEKWDQERQWCWIKDTLTRMKLRLDDETNYEDAFRTPARINRNCSRIYHHTGVIIAEQGRYIIESTLAARNGGIQVPFRIMVDPAIVSDVSPKSHIALLLSLDTYANDRQDLRWYVYGTPRCFNDGFVIRVDNFDYLYLKKSFSKRQQ